MDRVTIKIPRQLYKQLGQMSESVGFSSVNELIVFLMRIVAMNDDATEDPRKLGRKMLTMRRKLHKLVPQPDKTGSRRSCVR